MKYDEKVQRSKLHYIEFGVWAGHLIFVYLTSIYPNDPHWKNVMSEYISMEKLISSIIYNTTPLHLVIIHYIFTNMTPLILLIS